MPKDREVGIGLIALIAFTAWLFVGLPFVYAAPQEQIRGEILGVKYGEWLLFLATVALAITTWMLVRSAEDTAERQLRAYVFPKDVTIANIASSPEVTVSLYNCGQTPAHDHTVWATMGVAGYPLLDEPLPPANDPKESKGPLAPGDTTHFFATLETPITQAELNGMKEGRVAIYVAGAVLYTDAFGKHRFTKFCFFRGDAGRRTHDDGPMSTYPKWNEAN